MAVTIFRKGAPGNQTSTAQAAPLSPGLSSGLLSALKAAESSAPTPPAAATVAPWDADPNYTILDALKDFSNKKFPGKRLRLMPTFPQKSIWDVVSYDPETSKVVLVSFGTSMRINPRIGVREVPLYTPLWY